MLWPAFAVLGGRQSCQGATAWCRRWCPTCCTRLSPQVRLAGWADKWLVLLAAAPSPYQVLPSRALVKLGSRANWLLALPKVRARC